MKDKKDKRKHHESTIGKIIYGFLLFAPLLAILSTCLYATFNKNAYQSYAGVTETQTTNINTNTYNSQTIYNLKYKAPSQTNSSVVNFSYISLTPSELNISQETYNTLTTWSLRANNTIWFGNETTPNKVQKYLTENIFKNFNFMGEKNTNMFSVFDVTFVNVVQSKLSETFYYAINKVEESTVFNWSKNTTIYTVLNNTSNTLGITNTFWPMLMAYWLLISVIYILYDIVLMMLVIFHRKVHCLQDSI